MLGMYPENPGSGTPVFSSPGFPRESIHRCHGKTVTINAPGASPTHFYVHSLGHQRPAGQQAVHPALPPPGQGRDDGLDPRHQPELVGQRTAGRPALIHRAGLRPVVGYTFSSQQSGDGPGIGTSTVQLSARNATVTARRPFRPA